MKHSGSYGHHHRKHHHEGPHHEGHHGGHRGHGEHEGRGGPGRFFDSADLRYLILHLISDNPRHGYEIIKTIERLSSGAHSPSPGIIYPTLTMLEEMGAASVAAEGTRKSYSITDEGRRDLEANRRIVEAVLARMVEAGQRHAHERPVPILRAMENLKLVLRMRSGNFSPEQMNVVTDIIDNAAKQIERL